jgi:hypothetical protein
MAAHQHHLTSLGWIHVANCQEDAIKVAIGQGFSKVIWVEVTA